MVETVPSAAIPGSSDPIRRGKGDHRGIGDVLAQRATPAMSGALSGESSGTSAEGGWKTATVDAG